MRRLLFYFVAFAALSTCAWGDDVAIVSVQFGKEKKLRQFVIELYEQSAPQTVENFKRLARKNFYRGIAFHRVFPGALVQVGDPLSKRKDRSRIGTGGPGYTLQQEIGRRHETGAVAMARLPDRVNPARRSNGSQFFVTLVPMRNFDGQYTVFGRVISGLDLLDQISRLPTDTNDNPLERVTIRSVRIAPRHVAESGN